MLEGRMDGEIDGEGGKEGAGDVKRWKVVGSKRE
jgi:hypothetical protein